VRRDAHRSARPDGDRPVVHITHAGYLVASVTMLPLLHALTRPGSTIVVVEVRLVVTGSARG
jgi:hypothetical protein